MLMRIMTQYACTKECNYAWKQFIQIKTEDSLPLPFPPFKIFTLSPASQECSSPNFD